MFHTGLTGHYTHNKIAAVPWKALSQDINYRFIDSKTLPDATVLLDPSKLRLANVSLLWNHWVRRQKANQQGLVFIKAQEEDKRIAPPDPVVRKPSNHNVLPRDSDEVDFFANLSQAEDDQEPHPESPAAHVGSEDAKIKFLRGLSSEPVYVAFVDELYSPDKVSTSHVS
jgi:hypothetical protein